MILICWSVMAVVAKAFKKNFGKSKGGNAEQEKHDFLKYKELGSCGSCGKNTPCHNCPVMAGNPPKGGGCHTRLVTPVPYQK